MTNAPISELTITEAEAGQRLDRFLLKQFPEIGFALVNKLCRKGQIRLDGGRVKGNERLLEGQKLRVPPMLQYEPSDDAKKSVLSRAEQQWLRSLILFEDNDVLVLNKPAGIPVQAGSGHSRSIDRLLVALMPETPPKLVHRLDKDTSGCLVLGLHTKAASNLAQQFAERDVQKTYWAVVAGAVLDPEGEIDFALQKAGGEGHEKMHIMTDGQPAETSYRRLQRKGPVQWLEVHPRTGRTHQIRAHLAIMGAPIVGDTKYEGDEYKAGGQRKMLLHARSVTFVHPIRGEEMTVTAPLPDAYREYLEQQGWSLPHDA